MDAAWPRSATYTIGSILNWAMFLAAVALLSWATREEALPDAAVAGVVAVLVASVAAQFVAAYRLIARQDEYVRGITAKRAIAATGVTVTAAVLWGLGAQFLALPAAPMWVVYPCFWGAFGMVTPFIRDSLA